MGYDDAVMSRHRVERRRRRIRRALRELSPGGTSGVGSVFAPVDFEPAREEPLVTPHRPRDAVRDPKD
jgi:hypothetical protein